MANRIKSVAILRVLPTAGPGSGPSLQATVSETKQTPGRRILVPRPKSKTQLQPKTFLLAALITLSIGASIYEGLLYWHGLQVKGGAALLWPFVFLVLLVAWVDADSKDYPQIYRPFEYGYLVFLFWLPYLPYYLWRTRGATGVFILGGFIGLFMLSTMVQWLIYAVR